MLDEKALEILDEQNRPFRKGTEVKIIDKNTRNYKKTGLVKTFIYFITFADGHGEWCKEDQVGKTYLTDDDCFLAGKSMGKGK